MGATGIKINLSKTHLVREIIKLIRFTVEHGMTGESSLKKSRKYLTRPDHFSKIKILVASKWAEKILIKAGDSPNRPKILLVAPTGKAASLIGIETTYLLRFKRYPIANYLPI